MASNEENLEASSSKQRVKTTERLCNRLGTADNYNEHPYNNAILQSLLSTGLHPRVFMGQLLKTRSVPVATVAIANTVAYVKQAGGKRFDESGPQETSLYYLFPVNCVYTQNIYAHDDQRNYTTNPTRAAHLAHHLTGWPRKISLSDEALRFDVAAFFQFLGNNQSTREALMHMVEHKYDFGFTDADRFAMLHTMRYFIVEAVESGDPKLYWRKSQAAMQRRIYQAFKKIGETRDYRKYLTTVEEMKSTGEPQPLDLAKYYTEKGVPMSPMTEFFKTPDRQTQVNMDYLINPGCYTEDSES